MAEQINALVMVLHRWLSINTSLSSLFFSTSEHYAFTTAMLCINNHHDFLQLLFHKVLTFTEMWGQQVPTEREADGASENHHHARQEFPV